MVQIQGHAAKGFDRELATLVSNIKAMGEAVSDQLLIARAALTAPKAEHLEQVRAIDKRINALEAVVEEEVMELISRYNPMMRDLRFITYSLKIVTLLEHTGDLAKNSVRRLSRLGAGVPADYRNDLDTMAHTAHHMLTRALLLIEEYNNVAVSAVLTEDDRIDQSYKKLKNMLRSEMANKPNEIPALNHLQFINRNLEHVADYAVEIVRILAYVHTGDKISKSAA